MSDLREQVAQAITAYIFGKKHDVPFGEEFVQPWLGIADAALAVMGKPDPEPVTAGDADWSEDPNEIAYKTPWHDVAQEFNGSSNSGWRGFTSVYRDAHAENAQNAVAKAIDLGLAVSPDDPRLQPVEMTDDLIDVYLDAIRRMPGSPPLTDKRRTALTAVVAHINAQRALVAKGGEGE